jgi:hypothetical protein
MAHLNGRKWIGIDISEKYANLARERMEIAKQLEKEGYERKIVSSSQKTITSDGKLSHKEISTMNKKTMLETMLKWQEELTQLKKEK